MFISAPARAHHSATSPHQSLRLAVRRLLPALPVLLLLGALALRAADRSAYDALVDEDSPVEWLTFLVYAAAAAVALLAARALHRQGRGVESALYVGLGLGLVFVTGEEVSWGQRQLGFDGPTALVEANRQEEANLHNLLARRNLHLVYIGVGLYGAGLGRLLARRLPWVRHRVPLVAPPPALAAYFGTTAALYVYYDYLDPVIVRLLGAGASWSALGLERLQEPVELGLAAGFLLFVLGVLRGTRSS